MLYIKENNGITITALVIMIIVIMLLAGITITQGSDLIKNTKVETYVTNMITIRSKAKVYAEETNAEEPEATARKLKMTVDGQEIPVTLYDTPAANALYEMLPLELSFEDFNGIEKISYLSQELPTEGEPDGCDPDVGDLCLYAPWGNLSVFYQDFRYSDNLILLGHVDSGMELLAGQNEDFSVTLESAEE